MDRRQFLGTMGVSALGLAVAQTTLAGGAMAAPNGNRGYRVGDLLPKLKGLDQYGATGTLHQDGKWTLIDVCAWWCAPCLSNARAHRAFSDYLNNAGVPFELTTVIYQDGEYKIADRHQAERWAHAFHLEVERVLHPGGELSSPLARLLWDITQANGAEAAIPCYLLVDPSGTVRLHRAGFALEEVQALIAQDTGRSLVAQWDPWDLPGPSFEWTDGLNPVRLRGRTANGVEFDETVSGQGLVVARDISGAYMMDPQDGFDVTKPVNAMFSFAEIAPPTDLVAVPRVTTDCAFWQFQGEDSRYWEYRPEDWTVQPGSANVQYSGSNVTIVVPEPKSLIGAEDVGDPTRFKAVDFGLLADMTVPFTASQRIAEALTAEASLDPSVKNHALKLLEAITANMARRDFLGASDKAMKLSTTLQTGPAPWRYAAGSLASCLPRIAHLQHTPMANEMTASPSAGPARRHGATR